LPQWEGHIWRMPGRFSPMQGRRDLRSKWTLAGPCKHRQQCPAVAGSSLGRWRQAHQPMPKTMASEGDGTRSASRPACGAPVVERRHSHGVADMAGQIKMASGSGVPLPALLHSRDGRARSRHRPRSGATPLDAASVNPLRRRWAPRPPCLRMPWQRCGSSAAGGKDVLARPWPTQVPRSRHRRRRPAFCCRACRSGSRPCHVLDGSTRQGWPAARKRG